MFKWPGMPSARAEPSELADFAELCCLRDGLASMGSVSRQLGRLEENDYSEGVPEDDEVDEDVEAAYGEIEQRSGVCRAGYPFELTSDGRAILLRSEDGLRGRQLVYTYLLLATRLRMDRARTHAGIDGTELLERLGESVGREYLGCRSEGMVFGSAAGDSDFRGRVEELCTRLKEGRGYVDRSGRRKIQGDGKLDVVVWKAFSDELPGKLIAFGQCKTGTSYEEELAQLQPDAFCRKWIDEPFVVVPVRMFFLAEAVPRCDLYDFSVDAGVLFDRCRIVDYSEAVNEGILEEVGRWTEAAAVASGLDAS